MARGKKIQPSLHYDDRDILVSGVGSGVGLAFVESYFSKAYKTIRIASGYFQLTGFDLARKNFNPDVQLRILVRSRHNSAGRNVQMTAIQVIEEMVADLGQWQIPLVEAVREIVKQMDEGRFF